MKHPKDIVDYECKKCKLWKTRTQVVWGNGVADAALVFLGEAPGREEDETGVAFVGRAGKLLRKILKLLRLTNKVLILNILKCRPPSNRRPSPDEIEACMPFLMKQLKVSNTKMIVCLGSTAWSAMTNLNLPVTKEHGIILKRFGYRLILTYHPSYLLRKHDKMLLKQFITDIRAAKDIAYGKIGPYFTKRYPTDNVKRHKSSKSLVKDHHT